MNKGKIESSQQSNAEFFLKELENAFNNKRTPIAKYNGRTAKAYISTEKNKAHQSNDASSKIAQSIIHDKLTSALSNSTNKELIKRLISVIKNENYTFCSKEEKNDLESE